MEASYLEAWRAGLLEERIVQAKEQLKNCRLCPRNCGVDRLNNERGLCRIGASAEIASYGPHFGEESVLVGNNGSGTIFVCGCNLLCVFCQNYDISRPGDGSCTPVSDQQFGSLMVGLQQQGCHNINIVTPSHIVPQLLSALPSAIENGLKVPLVFNSGGYDKVETLQLLDGIVDIYMPDFKFWSPASAKRYMTAADYPERARLAIREMHRQVGDLQVNRAGLAVKGLLVRHLLMPGGREDTGEILRFLAEEVSRNCYVNIMDQYRPCGIVAEYAEIDMSIDPADQKAAISKARELGLGRLDEKDLGRMLKRLFSR